MVMIATDQAAELCVTEEELTIQLPNDISVGNAAEVVSAAIEAWDQGGRPGHLVLDLSAVSHMDSPGAAALVSIRHRMNSAKEAALPPSPGFLWSVTWMLLILTALAGMIAASYPALQQYQARVEQTQARAR
jgi:anti-anti-sigma factor